MELNNLDLNKLNVFFNVAERGGVTPAAKHLLLTRSAISQSVSALESSLDTPLFHRIGKRMVLTDSGHRLHEAFRGCQKALRSAIQDIAPSASAPRGLVRIGLFIGFSKTRLTDFISRFLLEHPSIQLKLLFVSQADLKNLLLENKIDFALSIFPLRQESPLIASAKLFEEELVLVSGKRNFIARPTLKQVLELPMIDYYQNGQLARSWIRHHFGTKFSGELKIRAYGAAIDFVLELILRNTGVGILPKHVAEPYLRRRRLFQMSTGKPELADFIWLNEIQDLRHEAAPGVFVERMRQELIT